MFRTTLLALPFAFAALFAAPKVLASENYPAAIRFKAQLTYAPSCTLCHAEKDGSDGKVATEFARTLWALGMRGKGDVVSLEIALDKVRARKWDTDGDGVIDVDELVASTDPSGPALSNVDPAEFGCAISGAFRPSPHCAGWSLAASAFVLVASRFRRRNASSAPSQYRRPR